MTKTHFGKVLDNLGVHRRSIECPDGRFLIADDDHPEVQVGQTVLVQYDPQDQFATIVVQCADAQGAISTPHTPGPWSIEAEPNPDNIIVLDPMNYHICVGGGREADYFTEEEIANARLIASAPELLEACKTVRTMLDSMQNEREIRIAWGHLCYEASVQQAFELFDRAIAKAEGRSE